MDSDGLPIIGKGIDLKLIEALQHKRTLAYINHFLIQTTGTGGLVTVTTHIL